MLWAGKPYISVRVLGPGGQYPKFEIRRAGHIFVATRELVWSAVLQPALDEDWELGEVSVLSPEEVRLFSALTLSAANPWEKGRPIVTLTARGSLDPRVVGSNLTQHSTFTATRNRAEEIAREALGGNENRYNIRALGSADSAEELLDNIDTNDQLILAGLARLLGAERVMAATQEFEEVSLSLFAAFGAAMQYVRLALSSERQEASFEEVYAYVERTFPEGAQVVSHLKELYELRLTATHPANRMGEFWAPPLDGRRCVFSSRHGGGAVSTHLAGRS